MLTKKSYIFLLMAFLILLCWMNVFVLAVDGDNTTSVKSEISQVTVFPDRALVTRTASLVLDAGQHRLLFAKLPLDMIAESIRIEGQGDFQLNDISYRKRYLEVSNEKSAELEKQINELEQKQKELIDKIDRITKEKQVMDGIMLKVTHVQETKSPTELDPANWAKMVDFYRGRIDNLDKEKRSTEVEKKEVDKKIDRLQTELRNLGNSGSVWSPQVVIDVLVKKSGPVKLGMSYVVLGTTWMPAYDLHASTSKRKLIINYKAVIKQKTTEDWTDVNLTISTARPSMGATHPDLSPWVVDFSQPEYLEEAGISGASNIMPTAPSKQMIVTQTRKKVSAKEGEAEMKEMEVSQASVALGSTAVIYQVAGQKTIKSDNTDHTVIIAVKEFGAHFRYSTIPKLSPYAYLKAKVKNTSDYIFLPGKANVYLDNAFVATTQLEFAGHDAEFWTFLGVDEGIKVEYKIINKSAGDKGFISKKNVYAFESEIILKNNKKTEEEIVVWDQIPIPSHEDIKVKLIEPPYKTDSDNLKMNNQKMLEWLYHLKPGQEVKIPFKIQVEYPKDKQINFD